MAERPNILWVCTDQHRHDAIRSLGNEHIRTPNLDRLASEGVAFSRCYSQSPVCTPSRACFLTGRYPRTTRCRQNGQKIPDDEVLVTRMLADEGWDCGLAGKLHLAPCDARRHDYEERIDDGYRRFWWSHHPQPSWPRDDYNDWLAAKGVDYRDLWKPIPDHFETWPGVPAEYHQTTWCAERAIEFMSEERDGPWLMSVNPFDPHHPFDPPQEYMDRYDPDDVPAPMYREGELDNKPEFQRIDHQGAYGGKGITPLRQTEREKRELVAAYYAMVELIDDQVGRVLQALEDAGQRENTLILFHSDHGEMLGDHGILLKGPHFYDCAVRVPLMASWPGHFREGLVSDALVELTDLAPTLAEVAGITLEQTHGRSLVPMLVGRSSGQDHRRYVRCEYYDSQNPHVGEQTEHRPSFATMHREGKYKLVVYHEHEPGELYDLERDPDEFTNLWSDPDYRAIKMDLLKKSFDASMVITDPGAPQLGRY